MRVKEVPTFEARIYIGSRVGYGGQEFTKEDVVALVQTLQAADGDRLTTVRVSPTEFVAGQYREPGWEVTSISYPLYPHREAEVRAWTRSLAEHLLARFGQNRVSIVYPDRTVMLEADNAAMTPVC